MGLYVVETHSPGSSYQFIVKLTILVKYFTLRTLCKHFQDILCTIIIIVSDCRTRALNIILQQDNLVFLPSQNAHLQHYMTGLHSIYPQKSTYKIVFLVQVSSLYKITVLIL